MMKLKDPISIIAILAGIIILVAGLPAMVNYINYRFGNPAEIPESMEAVDAAIKSCSERLGVDHDKLISCIDSGEKESILTADQELVEKYKVRGVPGFVVGCSYLFAGAYSPRFMDQAIILASDDEILNETQFKDWCLIRATNKTCSRYTRIIGNETCKKDGKILVQEFLDINCPECYRAQTRTIPWLRNNTEIVFEQHHATHTKRSKKLATAVECASDFGKRDEFLGCIFNETFGE